MAGAEQLLSGEAMVFGLWVCGVSKWVKMDAKGLEG